jgi:hypothetical protein
MLNGYFVDRKEDSNGVPPFGRRAGCIFRPTKYIWKIF